MYWEPSGEYPNAKGLIAFLFICSIYFSSRY